MSKLNSFAAMLVLAIGCTISTPAFAQDDSPDDQSAFSSLIDAALIAFEEKVDAKCECSEDFTAYERCLNKEGKKVVDAFSPKKGGPIKYTGGSKSEFKSAVADDIDSLVTACEDEVNGDDGDDDQGDDAPPGDSEPPQGGDDTPPLF